LEIPEDVVRFSFQRFQDHLIGESLLSTISNPASALKKGGPLSFVHNGRDLNWQWQGLIDALSIQIPEKYKVELIDALPGGLTDWNRWQITNAFMESIRWRDKRAFTKRTLELFNRLRGTHLDQLSILIELSVSIEHPWNAEFIHKNLIKHGLIKRDKIWTTGINDFDATDESVIGRLINWSLLGQTIKPDPQALRLCATTLCWLLCSTNRSIRDNGTKALTSILLMQENLFGELLAKFKKVDDLYVHERLIAAAYGACCLDPTAQRLKSYASSVFNFAFRIHPPRSILLRDYARGIIELCNKKTALPDGVNIAKCRPPYKSPIPSLGITEARIKRVARRAGDNIILNSCSGQMMGDFGSYEISPRVGHFTMVKLTEPSPVTAREKFEQFQADVVLKDAEQTARFQALRGATVPRVIVSIIGEEEKAKPSRTEIAAWTQRVMEAQRQFLILLSRAEVKSYVTDAAPWLGIGQKQYRAEPPKVNLSGAMRWAAKTAYEFGWTKKRFPRDTSPRHDYSRERPRVERIGKKYQWMALDDLLCRLADNYWVGSDWGRPARVYDTPLDLGFERDIDPTILFPSTSSNGAAVAGRNVDFAWISEPTIEIPEVAERDLSGWPRKAYRVRSLPSLTKKIDLVGRKWTVLYERRTADKRYEDKLPREHGLRLQEWYVLMCVFVSQADCDKLVGALRSKRHIDVMDWDPQEFTDGPFLREAPWRETWSQEQWWTDCRGAPERMQVAFPVFTYHWESHLDASMPNGSRAVLPAPWLANALSLQPVMNDATTWLDLAGSASFLSVEFNHGRSVLIRDDLLTELTQNNSLACIWVFVAERAAWPGGDNKRASWRRSEGVCWLDEKTPKRVQWHRDSSEGRKSRQGSVKSFRRH
jgi:hypothetical protein